jgi:hypothetical protein
LSCFHGLRFGLKSEGRRARSAVSLYDLHSLFFIFYA